MTNSDDNTKMLRTIINGQSAFRQEVLSKIDKLDKKLTDRIGGVETNLSRKIDQVEKNLTGRIDKLGKQLAYLEDDAPTREEFDNLDKGVGKLEQKTVSV